MSNYVIPQLPLNKDFDSKVILKKLTKARAALAELNGVSAIIPNQNILLNTLSLQEAKDSSAIENIVTTDDELYKSDALTQSFVSHAAKEVYNYAAALKNGFEEVKKTELLTNNYILEIQARLEENKAGFRKLPGTALKNDKTSETVYTPPQDVMQIQSLMSNLEKFLNDLQGVYRRLDTEIIIITSEVISARIMENLFKKESFESVRVFGSSASALRHLDLSGGNALVLLDPSNTGMSAGEFFQYYRKLKEKGRRDLKLLLSIKQGSASPSREVLQKLKIDGVLLKPLRLDDLKNELKNIKLLA